MSHGVVNDCVGTEEPTKLAVGEITAEMIQASLNKGVAFSYIYKNKDELMITNGKGEFYQLGKLQYIEVVYGDHFTDDETGEGFMSTGGEYFHPSEQADAIAVFLKRLNSNRPQRESTPGHSLERVKALG